MYLAITDGTTSVVLSGIAPVLGCTYYPRTAQRNASGEYQPVTEDVTVNMRGTGQASRDTINILEWLLEAAARRQETGVDPRVFALYKPIDSDPVAARSEIYGGRVLLSNDPGLRRFGDTNPTIQIGIVWTRSFWWEGAEVELQISANAQAAATGGRTITNDPANGNWFQVASTQIGGYLPAPVRVHLSNNTGSTQNYRRVMIGVNAKSDPSNFVHYLQGEARLSGGTTTAAGSASGGNLLEFTASSSPTTFSWTLPQADLRRSQGRRFRILARFDGTGGPLYVRPEIRTSGGVAVWSGDELALGTLIYESWQDLGIVPLPPGGYNTEYGAMRLALTFRGSGVVYLDILQLTALDSYRHLEMAGTGVPTVANVALVHDGVEGQTYLRSGSADAPVPTSFGGPLMIQPGYNNRFYVVHQVNAALTAGDTDAAIDLTFSARLYYRSRKLTV